MRRELALESWAKHHAYATSVLMVAVVTAFGFAAARILHLPNLDVLYLLAVLVSALTGGRRPAIFTAVLSAVVFDYCFIPPQFSFHVTDLPYVVTLIVFLIVGAATSELAARARRLTIEEAARAQAEACSRAKDEILNKISHELRSPLTGVLGWSQQIERVAGDHDRLVRGLSGLQHSAELLARLVDDLLNTSRITAGKLSVRLAPVAPGPVVSRVVEGMALVATERQVAIGSTIGPVGEIMGDEQRLEQITRNLLSNAIKFTPPGGRITVTLTRTPAGCVLVVSDTGIGVAPEFLPHVFEQFTQASADNAHGGLGLGLSIVKYLVEAHGGSIAVASAGPNLGTTFTVSLPSIVLDEHERDRPRAVAERT